MPALTFDDILNSSNEVEIEKVKPNKSAVTFDDILEDNPEQQQSNAITFDDIVSTPEKATQETTPKEKVNIENPAIQGTRSFLQQYPFGKRLASLATGNSVENISAALEAFPPPKSVPGQLGAGVGSLAGMMPSFRLGGVGGSAVKGAVLKKLVSQLPRAAKYIAASAGGATTFTGARGLRNIAQNKPVQEGLPEEALSGAVFGPTGEIRSYPGAVVTATGLGALMAPEGEKLSSAILFGGLAALTHQKPDLSVRDKAEINKLYQEATINEGIRTTQKVMRGEQKALPAPETTYGEGFSMKAPGIPVSTQKLLTGESLKQLEYRPGLEEGVVRQGEGFSVVGGKQRKGAIAKGKAQELRTTPTADETIERVAKESPTIKEKVREVGGVVITPKDLEPISKPKVLSSPTVSNLELETRKLEAKSKELDIKLAKRKLLSTPTEGKVERFQIGDEVALRIMMGNKYKTTNHYKIQSIDGENYIVKSLTSGKVENIPINKLDVRGELTKAVESKLSTPTGKGLVNKRGSVMIAPELIEPITKTATKIYRGVAPTSEVLRDDKAINSMMAERQRKIAEIRTGTLPESILKKRLQEMNNVEKDILKLKEGGDGSTLVTWASDAIDKERAFTRKYTTIVDLAEKVGITENSKASEIVFKALDYRRASPEEIATLTPDQQKFIPILRNAYKEIWSATGKTEAEGVREYATHLINDGLEKGYDISPLGRFLPDELYSRFFEKRKGGQPYAQDIIKAFKVYLPNVGRKIFREPVLDNYKSIETSLGVDFKNESIDFMEAFLGRGRYKGEEVLGRLPRDLVRLTYEGTLYGNLSAATKNATQVLTNTVPELGIKSSAYGLKRFMTPEGRQEFVNSGLAGDFTLGKPINQLDFFSQVEFLNRGITYLAAKHKALNNKFSLEKAEIYAKHIVRKTQFIQTGVDTPKLYRQLGGVGRAVGQFTQFPTKQGFLLYNWARQGHWDKVARFAGIAYLLGGASSIPFLNGIIDGDYKQLPQMPDDLKRTIRNIEKHTSLAGISGMDIGQNFGFGIYDRGVPLGRGPALGLFKEIGGFAHGVATREITSLQDIIRSRLFQKSLPTLLKGGTSIKKIMDLISNDLADYKVRNAYNQLQYISTPKEEILKVLVGPTRERRESWESIKKSKLENEIYRNEHRKMLDYTLESNGDMMALEEFSKKYPNYNPENITTELKNRIKERELDNTIRGILRKPKALRYYMKQSGLLKQVSDFLLPEAGAAEVPDKMVKDYFRKKEGLPPKGRLTYLDTAGIKTSGIGHKVLPGENPKKMDKEATLDKDIEIHTKRAKKLFPSLDTYPNDVQVALIDGVLRGEHKLNYKTTKLINSGQWDKVADEYLDNDEYRRSKNPKNKIGGIAKRMDEHAETFRNYARSLKKK